MTKPLEPIEHRLRRLSTPNPKTNCWEITPSKGHEYGLIRYNYRIYQTHKLSYMIFVGPVPEGMMVLHKCDNPRCINPSHLFLGTNHDNMIDREEKGRGQATIPDSVANEIRAEYAGKKTPMWKLANRYGVSATTINSIIHRTTATVKERSDDFTYSSGPA